MNFSFRQICNRCKIGKIDSELLKNQCMYNMMNYAKILSQYKSLSYGNKNTNYVKYNNREEYL